MIDCSLTVLKDLLWVIMPVAVKSDSEKSSPSYKEGIISLCALNTEAQRRREDQAKFSSCFLFIFSILLCVSEPLCFIKQYRLLGKEGKARKAASFPKRPEICAIAAS
ncbi:MAG: hypothetical protein A3G18_12965 [Rhodospirillales bacterium RIFCSPLOWO2_12_FULL_58_28]|nr:MAG: hypothetical protein A3H92_12820 [Rhodospirillales bacterium RIFCSPLOWO2_02_FULL_58_16]OHC78495.1 MAG: hypothetical protein A3G18_12965 [Rhodospirillales bacterium RIFCSPLOWO2_12_FULL_58_28]